MALAKITFYGIDECGYYSRDGGAPEFGDARMLMDEFRLWAKDGEKTLGETCTYHPKENSHLLRTFCYDCVHHEATGDQLLVTWNESPSFEGSIAHVSEDSRVGDTAVSNLPLPDGAIPGFPTYFLFLPSERAYATIRFNSPLNGNAGLQKLLKEFLAKFTSHCIHDSEAMAEGRIKILGYRQSDDHNPQHLYARFSSSLLRQPAMLEYIRGSRTRITKIHRKNLLVSGARPDADEREMTLFARLFRAFGSRPEEPRGDVRVTYEMQVTPTENELERIIADWSSVAHAERTAWEDIGFQLQGEPTPHWLSSALVKMEAELRVDPDANEIVGADRLLADLQRIRPMLVRTINQRNARRQRRRR